VKFAESWRDQPAKYRWNVALLRKTNSEGRSTRVAATDLPKRSSKAAESCVGEGLADKAPWSPINHLPPIDLALVKPEVEMLYIPRSRYGSGAAGFFTIADNVVSDVLNFSTANCPNWEEWLRPVRI
jgi:hypothetical protein